MIDEFQDAMATHPDDMTTWSLVFDKLKKNLLELDYANISITLLQNLDIIARYIKWYDNGLASLRAELYFDRGEFINHGLSKNNAGFRIDSYDKAIQIWEEAGIVHRQKTLFQSKETDR